MPGPNANRLNLSNPIILFALCGGATGVLNALIMQYDIGGLRHFFGVFFGLSVALALVRLGEITPVKSLVVVGSFALSWVLAYQFAIQLSGQIDQMTLVGFIAGALGAAIVALGFAVLFPPARRPGAILRCVALGAAAGMLLAVDTPFALFIIWQSAIAASLGASIRQPA